MSPKLNNAIAPSNRFFMERALPLLYFGDAIFEVDLSKGFLVDTNDLNNRAAIADLPFLEKEGRFAVFFHPDTRELIDAARMAQGLPKGTRMYMFESIEKLDPEGYALRQGVPQKYIKPRTERRVHYARRIRLPKALFDLRGNLQPQPKSIVLLARKIMNWKKADHSRRRNKGP